MHEAPNGVLSDRLGMVLTPALGAHLSWRTVPGGAGVSLATAVLLLTFGPRLRLKGLDVHAE